MPSLYAANLAHPADWPGFRQEARRLLQSGAAPEKVVWSVAGDSQSDLFAHPSPAPGQTLPVPRQPAEPCPPPHVSSALLRVLEKTILHRSNDRLALMYRMLWRWQREPALRGDPLDPDMKQLGDHYRAVCRDAHRMQGFVRFRPVCLEASLPPWQVAWFEPRHRVLALAAPFFVRRFPNHRWAILTPDASAYWDNRRLAFGPGATARDAPPADADEAFWLTYYANVFNPARLKLAALRRGMPPDYWKNLPEAQLIGLLAATAVARAQAMPQPPVDNAT